MIATLSRKSIVLAVMTVERWSRFRIYLRIVLRSIRPIIFLIILRC